MTAWMIAGLLAAATGIRVGWGMVNKQSLVSSAMIVALASLGLLAALNWPPLAILVNTLLSRPNLSVALSQAALISCAAGSSVMITAVVSAREPLTVRRMAWAQYGTSALLSVATVTMFVRAPKQLEMAPSHYLEQHLGSPQVLLPWALPLVYVLCTGGLVAWMGLRHSNASRRGRALFVFAVGIVLVVVASLLFLIRAMGATGVVAVGSAVTVLSGAMVVVAAGSLAPTIEDWFGARREMRVLRPLICELLRRQPAVGIGVRRRGPLVYRVAEGMALASDAILLEATAVRLPVPVPEMSDSSPPAMRDRSAIDTVAQAKAVAVWIADRRASSFPGRDWLNRPDGVSDREWILAIAQQFRATA
jgi:hypothetical protein